MTKMRFNHFECGRLRVRVVAIRKKSGVIVFIALAHFVLAFDWLRGIQKAIWREQRKQVKVKETSRLNIRLKTIFSSVHIQKRNSQG